MNKTLVGLPVGVVDIYLLRVDGVDSAESEPYHLDYASHLLLANIRLDRTLRSRRVRHHHLPDHIVLAWQPVDQGRLDLSCLHVVLAVERGRDRVVLDAFDFNVEQFHQPDHLALSEKINIRCRDQKIGCAVLWNHLEDSVWKVLPFGM